MVLVIGLATSLYWRWRRCTAAAVGVSGLQVEDPAVSGEMLWRWPRIWCGWCSGQVPGRWSIIVSSSSDPARQSWWILQLSNASGLGVLPFLG